MRSSTLIVVICVAWITAVSAVGQQPQISVEQFEQWIFTNGNAQQAKTTLAAQIELEISRLECVAPLQESQKDRIRLAGNGDVKRFYDRVERARREFRALEQSANPNNINELYQLAIPLQQELDQGLFGPKSLLKQVIASTVDEQQSADMQREVERQREHKTQYAVMLFIAELGRQVPMTAAQRRELQELALANLEPFDGDNPYAVYLVSYRLSQIDRSKLESIFDKAQMRVVGSTLLQGKGMRATLKKQGLLKND